MTSWTNSGGASKIISRRVGHTGSFFEGDFRGHGSTKSMFTLPGYCQTSGVASQCVMQGIAEGYINKNVKVFGVERDEASLNGILGHAQTNNLNMTMAHAEFKDANIKSLIGNTKLDYANIDLMGVANRWIGQKIYNDIVPHLKKSNSGVSATLCLGFNWVSSDFDWIRDLYNQHKDTMKPIWDENHQGHLEDGPFTGVFETGMLAALPSWMSIHYYLKDVPWLKYRGCYMYTESSLPMLTIRYETENNLDWL